MKKGSVLSIELVKLKMSLYVYSFAKLCRQGIGEFAT